MKKRIHLELQSRRENLIFDGFSESKTKETWLDCENKIYKLFDESLGISSAKEIRLERVHMLGPKIPGKRRPIIAKFSFYEDRDNVWQNRTKLKNTNYWISEDFPQEIQRDRKILYPILRAAQNAVKNPDSGIQKVSLNVDKLILNGRTFTINDIDRLPVAINHIAENTDFLEALSEMWICNKIPYSRLSQQIFNVFEINDESCIPIHSSDPDLQYFNELTHLNTSNKCDYYLEELFDRECRKSNIDNDCLSMIHFNARSLPKHLTEWNTYLNSLDIQFSAIGVSETWLNESNAQMHSFYGYTYHYVTRDKKKGGGVSLFVKEDLSAIERPDICVIDPNIEAIFIEIPNEMFCGKKNNVVIGTIYRPPNTDLHSFIQKLNDILSNLKLEKKQIYLMGDFNINILESSSHLLTAEFIETIYSHSFFPLITKPTRLQGNSATLIDNIFCNDITNLNMVNGILYTDISDHFPVFSIDRKREHTNRNHTPVQERIYSQKNINMFRDCLNQTDWSDVMSNNEGQSSFSCFYQKFCDIYDQAFPTKVLKCNYTNKIVWLTNGLKKSIQIKNKLYIRCKKSKLPHDLQLYKDYKRKLQQIMRITERNYYHNLLQENQSNLKKTWKVLKDIIGRKKSNLFPKKFLVGHREVTDKKQIASGFNNYFTHVGTELQRNIPKSNINPLLYIRDTNLNSIYIPPVTKTELLTLILNLKESSCGYDGIHSRVIKQTYSLFFEPLKHVLNLSIIQGFFPEEMKIAKVIPLYKHGDASKFNNYRPISVLPLFSKLLEKLMYNRLLEFINKHNILYKYQFGFRESHSTSIALTILIDNIMNAIDEGNIVVGLFLDFQKAFDTVNHDILLQKLLKYGIRGTAYDWMRSYLSCRSQYVVFNNAQSPKSNVTCGVPQGSVLGPLLFLLYINDIVNVSTALLPIIFADDTNLFLKGKCVNEVIRLMNCEIEKIVHWLHANKLSLNISKTHYVIFRSQKRKLPDNEHIKINGQSVECVEYTKFIGVMLDSKLTWINHLSMIRSKVAKGIGILSKSRKVLHSSSLITLYYSLIYPYFTYCIEVWGSAANIHVSPLFKLQKKAARIIMSAPRRTPSAQLFTELGLLTVNSIYYHRTAIFVFKFIKNMSPGIVDLLFKRNVEVVLRSTRQKFDLKVPKSKSSLYMKSIRFQGVKIWNDISRKIDHMCSIHTFKKNLKSYLHKSQFA